MTTLRPEDQALVDRAEQEMSFSLASKEIHSIMTDLIAALHAAAEREAQADADIKHLVGQTEAYKAELAALRAKMKEPTEAALDAGLAVTATHLDIQGSQLTVNREKMRRRFLAVTAALIAGNAEVEK